jgi:uncharacterized Rmd1/YagE family protein
MAVEKALPGGAFRARALLLSARLDLRSWPEGEALARAPLTVKVPGGGVAVLFRYGVVVLFGVTPGSERSICERLVAVSAHRYESVETEELEIRVDPASAEGMAENALVLHSAGVERLQLIADALSKSLLLAHYEARIAGDFDRIEPLALELGRKGGIRGGTREHLKRIGTLLLMEHRMVGRAEIGEKPELLWEHPRLERLYALLEDEFEIRERRAALDRKVELAARTERTLVELISTRHELRVEWYIVALIVVEIVLTLYGMAMR